MEEEAKPVSAHIIENKDTKTQSLWEFVRFILLAIAIVFAVRIFIAEPFVVSGSSMFPTFKNGDYLIVDKLSYKFSEPKRDDVIVFKYPKDTTKYFIKRIIGLPNETVQIKGSVITIFNDAHKDGLVLDQPFVENQSSNDMSYTLGSDEYFVMGDNRSGSSDSRYWGPVKKDLLTGRAFLRLLPLQTVNVLPGSYKQKE